MNVIKYRVSLDMFDVSSQKTIKAKKCDSACQIHITLTENGKIYKIGEGCYATFNAKKSDGNPIYDNCTIEGDTIVYDFRTSVDENGICQVSACEGIVECEVTLYNANSEQLTSPRFTLVIDGTVYNGEEIISTPEANVLKELINEANETVEEIETKLANGEFKGDKGDRGDQGPQGIQGIKGDKGEKGEDGVITNLDQTYNPQSENAQSGKAVAEAVEEAARETDEKFNNVSSKTNSLKKRITNLEQGIIPSSFETDSTVAYQKIVPTNALPYAEFEKVGGMTRKCANLIPLPYDNKSGTKNGVTWTVNTDGSVTANGTATEDSTFYVIYVDKTISLPSGEYSFTSGGNSAGAYYSRVVKKTIDGNTINIDDKGGGCKITLNVGDNFYILLRVKKDVTVSNLTFYPMLNEGPTALPCEPYFEGLRSAKVTEVESLIGKNLFDYNAHVSNGNVSIIPIVPNKTLYRNSQIGILDSWKVYDATDTLLGTFASYGFSSSTSFVVPSNAAYIKTTDNAVLLSMFYIGYDSNTEYEPCVKRTLPIPEAVQALDGYGEGINETVYNYIDWEKKQFVKRVEKIVLVGLVGTETYNNYIESYDTINLVLKKVSVERGALIASESKGVYFSNFANIGFTASVFGVSTIEEWRSYVAERYANGNPITVFYELAEPIITDISNILPDDNYIEVEGGGILTFKNEYEYAVPSEIKYTLPAVEIENKYTNNTFSNALKSSAEGKELTITDASPVPHDLKVKLKSKNILPYPYVDIGKTKMGITYTGSEDGTVTMSGTTTALSTDDAVYFVFFKGTLGKGTYTFSADFSNIVCDGYGGQIMITNNSTNEAIGTVAPKIEDSNKTTFTLTSDSEISIRFLPATTEGTTFSGSFTAQLEESPVATRIIPHNIKYFGDLQDVSVTRRGAEYELYIEPQTANANADGIVDGLISIPQTMILESNNNDVRIECEYNLDINKSSINDISQKQDKIVYDFDETYIITEEEATADYWERNQDLQRNSIRLTEMQVDFIVPYGSYTGVQYLYFIYGTNEQMRVTEFAYQHVSNRRQIRAICYKERESFYAIHGYAWDTDGSNYTALQVSSGARMSVGKFLSNPKVLTGIRFNVAGGKPVAGTVVRIRGKRANEN